MKLYKPDDGTKKGEKRCAICGTIEMKSQMEFEIVENGPVIEIQGKDYKMPCWVCSQCCSLQR